VTRSPVELFASAVPFYARHRSGYPAGLVDALADRLGLDGRGHAVDVGCGAGQFAIPLARHVTTVTAIDPLPDMLDHGRTAALRAGVDNIDWRVGDSSQLAGLGVEGARLAVFAASFHWTDRAAVVGVLDGVLAPGAAIVVVNDVLDDADQPEWVHAVDAVRARYVGTRDPQRSGHADVLRASPFSAIDTTTWSWTRELTVDEVVGLQFSYSFSTPDLLGDRMQAFADEVRTAVLALHPSGTVVEPFGVETIIARRP
jgi:SAM-dependent methyltransferase